MLRIKQIGRKFCVFAGNEDTGRYAYTQAGAQRIVDRLAGQSRPRLAGRRRNPAVEGSAADGIRFADEDPSPEDAYLSGLPDDAMRKAAMRTPKYAYLYARDVDWGPRDDTRKAASRTPEYAFMYARDIDLGPQDDTRKGALADPEYALLYAREVDRSPRNDTRKAMTDHDHAFLYARDVDQGPHDATREVVVAAALARLRRIDDGKQTAFVDAGSAAYWYARDIDQGPRDDTRKAVMQWPAYAFLYARHVDRGPRDDTRRAASQSPEHAFLYARDVDRGPRDDTRRAASQSPEHAFLYARDVDGGPHAVTRAGAQRYPKWAYDYAVYIDKSGEHLDPFTRMEYDFEFHAKPVPDPLLDNRPDPRNSPEFRRWFGRSRVVDASGKPLVVYHGTPRGGWTAFRHDKRDAHHVGFFFSDSVLVAESYTANSDDRYTTVTHRPDPALHADEKSPAIFRVYLRIENPFIVDVHGGEWHQIRVDGRTRDTAHVAAFAKERGHDGVIFRNVRDHGGRSWTSPQIPADVFVVFEPNQIKSATGNVGTWDPDIADIRNPAHRRRGSRIRIGDLSVSHLRRGF